MTDNQQHPHGGGLSQEGLPTRTLVIDLAVVEDQLRSLALRLGEAGPTPHSTALRDQLQAHERDLLRLLRQRRLAFRAVTTPDGVPLGRAGGAQVTW